jgi:hypothetical protein
MQYSVEFFFFVSVTAQEELTNSMAQEPEGSSLHSQQPATGPCPEPVESNPHTQANLPKIHSDPIFPPTPSDENFPEKFKSENFLENFPFFYKDS